MKIIGSVKEDHTIEKRISITPDTAKKFSDLKLSVFLENNYANHIGILDDEYKKVGVSFCSSANEVYEKSQIVLKVNSPSVNEVNLIGKESILIGQFDPTLSKETINRHIQTNFFPRKNNVLRNNFPNTQTNN